MARGWESKSVEEQIEDRERDDALREAKRRAVSPEAFAAKRRHEGLRLTRSSLREQLERARTEPHREMLRRALEEIGRELAEPDEAGDNQN
jgi:hypothetical protein